LGGVHGRPPSPLPPAWSDLDAALLLRYDLGMSLTKRKVSISLDEDLVAELEATGHSP